MNNIVHVYHIRDQYDHSLGYTVYNSYTDLMDETIKKKIQIAKDNGKYTEYNPYIWNYQGEGKNYMPLSHLGCIWMSSTFETIYDVPLDGTYEFYINDSGQRGLGSFNSINCKKVEVNINIPKVSPGSLIPITEF